MPTSTPRRWLDPGRLTAADFRGILAPQPKSLRLLSRRTIFPAARFEQCAARVRTRFRPGGHAQGYTLRINPNRIEIDSATAVGAWYARMTLRQLWSASGGRLPCVEIEDWPDVPVRGVMLDVSRCKVPTMRSLLALIDRLAAFKINQLQLYTEHTFAYRRHRDVWRGCSPLTARQVRALDAFCRARFIDLVPNQNSLGHMERWLKHPRYTPLAETRGPWRTPWGETRATPSMLCPVDPRSLRLVESLYDELLPNFSSRLFNAGCDEPFELGRGRSAAACRRRGVGRVYLDYVRGLHRAIRRHGRRMMIWADFVAAHPEILSRLPRDVILLEWGYEADHPFERRTARYRRAGRAFYVCPGTSSWCSFAGRTAVARANLLRAARAANRHGAAGYLITDWGDFGHRQFPPASYAPLLFGASAAWNADGCAHLDLERATSRWMFDDPTRRSAALWIEAGRVQESAGVRLKNRTVLFRVMQSRLDDPAAVAGLTRPILALMRRRIDRLRSRALRGRVASTGRARRGEGNESAWAQEELYVTLDVLDHACGRASAMLEARGGGVSASTRAALAADLRGIIERHRRLWLRRNRTGGLRESTEHDQRLVREYEAGND